MGSTASKLEAAKKVNLSKADQLKGKEVIAFGGTSGIAAAMSVKLASMGCNCTIVGRNQDAANEILKTMQTANPQGQFKFLKGDLNTIAGCDKVVTEFLEAQAKKQSTATAPRLDYVIYCQTKATFQGLTLVGDKPKIDEKLALNFYSRVYLTQRLLPLLRETAAKTGDVRVMSVLSAGVHASYAAFKEDPRLLNNYGQKNAADFAGFMTDLVFDKMARLEQAQKSGVSFLHAAPGFIQTNWGTDMAAPVRLTIRALQATVARSAEDCAEFMVSALLADSFKGFGLASQYGAGDAPAAKTALHTPEAVEFAWKDVNELLGEYKKPEAAAAAAAASS